MKTNHDHDIDILRSALASVDALEPIALVGEFRQFAHNCSQGSYCALILDPKTGETRTTNAPSWECSANEYFSESGILSDETLLSETRAHWSPSPDDSFEWCEGDDYVHTGNFTDWITAEAFAELEDADKARFTEWFSLSDRPVDGWVSEGWDDSDVKEVAKKLEALCDSIRAEISDLESAAVDREA